MDPADELVRLDRAGKPVAINALWVNALAALAGLLALARRNDREPRDRHAKARGSFLARFPAPEGWLHDLVEGPPAAYPLGAGSHHDDPTLRPGQLFAWSLPHAPMAGDAAALRAIGPALLTPLGVRTLAPTEYGYRGDGGDGRTTRARAAVADRRVRGRVRSRRPAHRRACSTAWRRTWASAAPGR